MQSEMKTQKEMKTQNKKRILIITNNSAGLYDFRHELIEKLSEDFWVSVLTPDGDKVELLEKICENVITQPMDRRGKNIVRDAKLLRVYWKLIRKMRPDAVLTYTIKPTIYGGTVCRFTGTPYMANITGLGTAIENPGVLRGILLKMYKFALEGAGCVFFQNAENLKFFEKEKILTSKFRVIPGSGVNIDLHCFEEYPDTKQYEDKFLFIGRIMKDKGINEFLEAAERVKRDYPRVTFEIIGYLDEDYEQLLQNFSEKGIINFLGKKQNVHPYLKDCNALIQPSYHEGMSNVLLEASSSGRPVLASDIPGCRETFVEGRTGFGFEARNTESLYQAIIRFLQLSRDEKAEMGRAAREKMEREFDRRIVIDAYMEELDILLEQ